MPRPSAKLVRIVVAAVLGLVVAWTAFYTVPAESEGVVLRFGRFSHVVSSGLNFKIPLGIDSVMVVPVKRQLKQEFGFGTPGSSNPWQSSPEADWSEAKASFGWHLGCLAPDQALRSECSVAVSQRACGSYRLTECLKRKFPRTCAVADGSA